MAPWWRGLRQVRAGLTAPRRARNRLAGCARRLGRGTEERRAAAADWIYEHRATYDIRVANFSLLAGSGASFMYDPLDQAVEKLWLSGVVVVTAVGNYASDGQASGVPYAPANDPFVITVGAADVNGTVSRTTTSTLPGRRTATRWTAS